MNGESMDLNMLQVNLHEKLSKSKFLIVIDDVWEMSDAKWDLFSKPFQSGNSGSRILVTARSDVVANVVGSVRTSYHMWLLTDEDCLALLAQSSQTSLDENSELREVGEKLAKRCKGLPLAAKALGGLLRSNESTEYWDYVLKSKIWDSIDYDGILPVLKLSYHHLPTHLKPLFAYCSLFPKEYEFDKNELVLLWMGEGFLENKTTERKTKEELGHEYFNELLARYFFQQLSGRESFFVMHDFINHLAQTVAGSTSCLLKAVEDNINISEEYRLTKKVRRVSFLSHEYEVFIKFKACSDVQGLRTLLPIHIQNFNLWPPCYLPNKLLVELVSELHSLRVMSLSGFAITEVPSIICSLIQLRYLNLSGTSIVTLPDSLGNLYRLETLLLCNCRDISSLPSRLGYLQKLRHLDVSDTEKLKDMPVEISSLINLQTLPKIVLSKAGGTIGLKELV